MTELREKIAREVDADIWTLFEKRARQKEWTPAERQEEFADAIARGGRLARSLERADAILNIIKEHGEELAERKGWNEAAIDAISAFLSEGRE